MSRGEGLAIGSAYAIGSPALGAALVVGFALHNTTEGLAIVAPRGVRDARIGQAAAARPAGGRARLAWRLDRRVGVPSERRCAHVRIGAGAIAQVVVQISRSSDESGRFLHPLASVGVLSGLLVMYLTGLLVSV